MTASQTFLQLFAYVSNWDFQLNLVFLLAGIAYLLLTGPVRCRFKNAEPVKEWKKAVFLTGLILYYFSLGSPLNLLAHEMFSMHMLQMAFLYFVVPPLLLLGLPAYLLRLILRVRMMKTILSFFTRPIFTLFLFNGTMSFYHVPVVFDTIMASEALHNVSHVILMFTALCMWWPIVAPVPEMDRLKPLFKLALIFGNGVLLTPACAMITFTNELLFNTYAEMSQLVPLLSPIHDQQLGGVIMKIMQEIVYITAISTVLVRWIRSERAKDEKELLELKYQAKLNLSKNEL
ncbi:cytochrome c oxidase assembly protein [Thermoactinomyces mirandus]|uniref:Cytochrome c oxidase assembly protein n=1 Tax=Thermoactinomyces mirandus TaxID=2756294 RepID=A0A7W2AQG3_9BACL|nr:cytochrome c oxidase assembly protein [Thermoactinomyces mirandus]MBA4601939.1 cytochrome c oxidase assembly protein [Thermoactinomyces mirandus]